MDRDIKLEDRLGILFRFSDIVEKKPEYLPVYELMITGASVKLNLPRKYVVDTLYYMKNNSHNISYTK